MNKFKILFILIFSMLFGCSSSKIDNEGCYTVTAIDSMFFNEYFLISILDKSKNTNYILSKKEQPKSASQPIISGETYCFHLNVIKAQVAATLKGRISQTNPDVYVNNKLLWSNGKIKIEVFSSKDIEGIYVVK